MHSLNEFTRHLHLTRIQNAYMKEDIAELESLLKRMYGALRRAEIALESAAIAPPLGVKSTIDEYDQWSTINFVPKI